MQNEGATREQNIRGAGAPDAPDCEDTIVADCREREDCGRELGICAPDTACIEPWLMDPTVCPEDVPIDVCYPDARPLMPHVCVEDAGGADETVVCKCVWAAPPGGSSVEPLPPAGYACPAPICDASDAACVGPCEPMPMPPVDGAEPQPAPNPDTPVFFPIEGPPLPCMPGPAVDCLPLPCDLPLPLREPQQEYMGPPCAMLAPCIDPQPDMPVPELRGAFPCATAARRLHHVPRW